MNAEDLIGTWRLKSWKNTGSDGSSVDPLGEAPVGFIFYNHDGYMSVEIMAAHRAPYHDADAFGGTIQICSFPNWIGNAQVRFANLDGNLLTLSTKPMTFQGVERSAHLVWERVGRD